MPAAAELKWLRACVLGALLCSAPNRMQPPLPPTWLPSLSPPCVPPGSYASVYQMLRGTLVIFAGLLTIVLLHRRLHSHHWCAALGWLALRLVTCLAS